MFFCLTDTIFSQPIISSISKTSGPVGTEVTINGFNFSAITNENIVYFGSVKALVSVASSTKLTVIAPVGATYQPISITTNNLTTCSNKPFNITFNGGGAITGNSFNSKFDLNVEGSPYDVKNADFDGDGKIDLVAVNGSANSVSVFRNTSIPGSITLGVKVNYPVGTLPFALAIADVDGDGKKDIITVDEASFTISILRNNSTVGNISFEPRVALPASVPNGVAICDLDKDGKPDIVTTNGVSNSISVFKNTGSVGSIAFSPRQDYFTGNYPAKISIGDIDGDNNPDIIFTDKLADSISIFKNNGVAGNISLTQITGIHTGNSPGDIGLADIDGDGKLDICIGLQQSISIYRNVSSTGTIGFNPNVNFTNSNALGIDIGDIDGDGKPDIAFTTSQDSVYIVRS